MRPLHKTGLAGLFSGMPSIASRMSFCTPPPAGGAGSIPWPSIVKEGTAVTSSTLKRRAKPLQDQRSVEPSAESWKNLSFRGRVLPSQAPSISGAISSSAGHCWASASSAAGKRNRSLHWPPCHWPVRWQPQAFTTAVCNRGEAPHFDSTSGWSLDALSRHGANRCNTCGRCWMPIPRGHRGAHSVRANEIPWGTQELAYNSGLVGQMSSSRRGLELRRPPQRPVHAQPQRQTEGAKQRRRHHQAVPVRPLVRLRCTGPLQHGWHHRLHEGKGHQEVHGPPEPVAAPAARMHGSTRCTGVTSKRQPRHANDTAPAAARRARGARQLRAHR
jgi:hypothetical protein